jgi:hypothetical protein
MEWGKVQITPEIEDEQEGKDVNARYQIYKICRTGTKC